MELHLLAVDPQPHQPRAQKKVPVWWPWQCQGIGIPVGPSVSTGKKLPPEVALACRNEKS